jgi:hypothetical protein
MKRTVRKVFAMPKHVLMNHPGFDWARPRAMRRRLVMLYALVIIVMAVCFGLATGLKSNWLLGGFIAGLSVLVLIIGSINASVRGITELCTTRLDEWQIARRDAMFRVCWLPCLALVGVVLFVCAMTNVLAGVKAGLAIGTFFVMLYLPTAALAWTLPEEPE